MRSSTVNIAACLALLCTVACVCSVPMQAAEDIPIRVDNSRENEWLEVLEPDLKSLLDEAVTAVKAIGEGDIDGAVETLDKHLMTPPGGEAQRKTSLHAAMAGLRVMPNSRFESVDLTTVRSLSSRVRSINLIAHGRFGPMLVRMGVDRYSNRWRLFSFTWTFDHGQIMAFESSPHNEGPILSYDLEKPSSVVATDDQGDAVGAE